MFLELLNSFELLSYLFWVVCEVNGDRLFAHVGLFLNFDLKKSIIKIFYRVKILRRIDLRLSRAWIILG